MGSPQSATTISRTTTRCRVAAGGAACAAALLVTPSHAQEPRVDETPRPPAPPLYQAVRYLEDDATLQRQAEDDFWAPVKRSPLGDDVTLSWGGQHRVRYELVEPANLGDPPTSTRSILLSRNLLHADLHLRDRLRLFVQVGSWLAPGVDDPQPPDADDVDLAQGFVEARAELGDVHLVVRVGRQEMALGSGRWVSLRDGANMRLAFDLVRATWQGGAADESWKVETFAGVLPNLQRGAFDDAPDPRNRFWGIYATVPLLPKRLLSLDAFYLGRTRDDVVYREVSGDEVRHTLGVRLFGDAPLGLEYIAHGLLQLGAIDEADVLAWGLAGALWKTLPAPLGAARLGVRGDVLSGDARAGDGRVGSFHPLFPNQTFFAALPAFYPSNLVDVHPLARLDLGATNLEAGVIGFWRQETADAIYRAPGAVAVPGGEGRRGGAPDAYTATQLSIGLGHQASRHVAVSAEYSHVFAGSGLTAGGGGDVDFFATWTTYTY